MKSFNKPLTNIPQSKATVFGRNNILLLFFFISFSIKLYCSNSISKVAPLELT